MTDTVTLHSQTADKIARLVDQMAEVFSNANVEELLRRAKVLKPILNTIATLAKTLALTLKLKKDTETKAPAQKTPTCFEEYSEDKKQQTISLLQKKAKTLRNRGQHERAKKLEIALVAKSYDQAIVLANLYDSVVTA